MNASSKTKQHQTKRAIINHIKDNRLSCYATHPEAVFTWTAQGVSPVPQGWHGTVLVVLEPGYIQWYLPISIFEALLFTANFRWQRVSVSIPAKILHQHFNVFFYHIIKGNDVNTQKTLLNCNIAVHLINSA